MAEVGHFHYLVSGRSGIQILFCVSQDTLPFQNITLPNYCAL